MLELTFEQRMRLKLNQVATKNAMDRLVEAHKESNDLAYYASVGELLLWVMNSHDWHKEHQGDEYEQRAKANSNAVVLYGMRHAFNKTKHNMLFMYLHEKTTDLITPFPTGSVATVIYIWAKAGPLLKKDRKSQWENYIEYLESKDVFTTFKGAMEFLEIENAKYFN